MIKTNPFSETILLLLIKYVVEKKELDHQKSQKNDTTHFITAEDYKLLRDQKNVQVRILKIFTEQP